MATATTPRQFNRRKNFAALFENPSRGRKCGRASDHRRSDRVDYNIVVVNAGLKSESFIPIENSRTTRARSRSRPATRHRCIESLEDGYGETRLSRDKAKRLKAWHDLEAAMEQGTVVSGLVTGKVKGGLTVMVNGIRAFLPGSLVDIRPVKDTMPFEGKELEFKLIKLDRKRNNVVAPAVRARCEPCAERDECSIPSEGRSSRASVKTSPITARR